MAMNKILFPTNKLKTRLLKENPRGRYVYYDQENDTLLIQVIPPQNEIIIHFLDDENVALLYEAKSKEIVGIQVEEFQKSFIPKHAGLKDFWTMSLQIKDVGELLVAGETNRAKIAEEVVKASKSVIQNKNEKIANVFTQSFSHSNYYASV